MTALRASEAGERMNGFSAAAAQRIRLAKRMEVAQRRALAFEVEGVVLDLLLQLALGQERLYATTTSPIAQLVLGEAVSRDLTCGVTRRSTQSDPRWTRLGIVVGLNAEGIRDWLLDLNERAQARASDEDPEFAELPGCP